MYSMKYGTILIVDDNEDVLFALNLLLKPHFEKVKVSTTPDRIEQLVRMAEPDVILLDMNFSRDASSGQEGMEVASGGTLFLDEIGNLSLPLQAKLLSAIEKGVFTRIGSTKEQRIDVRLICATNSLLHERVAEGTFRQDLLYRINTIELHIPPLRERGNDVLLLADYFVDLYKRKYRKEVDGLNAEAREKLMRYTWPGNVRELQHAVERAVILSDRRTLGAQLFALRPTPAARKEQTATLNLEQLERTAIAEALRTAEGNINRAAELLGITRYALYRKMEKYGI